MAAMGHLMLAPLVSTQYQSFSWWSSAMTYKCSSVQPPLRKTTNAFPRLPKCPKIHVWPTFRKHVNPLDLTQFALSPNLPDIRGRNDLQSPRQLLKDGRVSSRQSPHPTMLKHVETCWNKRYSVFTIIALAQLMFRDCFGRKAMIRSKQIYLKFGKCIQGKTGFSHFPGWWKAETLETHFVETIQKHVVPTWNKNVLHSNLQ